MRHTEKIEESYLTYQLTEDTEIRPVIVALEEDEEEADSHENDTIVQVFPPLRNL